MPNTQRIRELNDRFRKTLNGGRVLITRGISAREDVAQIIERVKSFDQFDAGNDPHLEHDFGAFQMSDTQQIFFKIDYYSLDLDFGSPDPSDPNVTARVLTVMLGSEY